MKSPGLNTMWVVPTRNEDNRWWVYPARYKWAAVILTCRTYGKNKLMLALLIVIGIVIVANVAHHYFDYDGILRPKDERVAWATTWRSLAIQIAVVVGIAILLYVNAS